MGDKQSKREVYRFKGHGAEISSLDISNNGKYLAAGGMGGTVIIWLYESRNILWKSNVGDIRVKLAISPDNELLATSSKREDWVYVVKLWDLRTGKLVATLYNEKTYARINCIAFNPQGTIMAVGRNGGYLDLWDIQSKELVRKFRLDRSVESLDFHPFKNELAAGISNAQKSPGEIHIIDHKLILRKAENE